MDQHLALGPIELTVADLARSIQYYTKDLGLQALTVEAAAAELGVPGRPIVLLKEIVGAQPAPESSPGLSHIALQVPTEADLARFVQHYDIAHPQVELTDHLLSHSCYLVDPDGHGIEVTCSRPRSEWRWQDGLPALLAEPLRMEQLQREPGADLPFEGFTEATEIGHVQLKVTDKGLTATKSFYCDILGFDVMGELHDVMLAVGVSDHRSLLVFTNRFGVGGKPAPADSARLLGADLLVSTNESLRELTERVAAAGAPHQSSASTLDVEDPSGNLLRFTVQPTLLDAY